MQLRVWSIRVIRLHYAVATNSYKAGTTVDTADLNRSVARVKMAELEQRTGVHRETIRVYLRNGLLPEPTRPRRNVAHYTEKHVAAIAAVQRLMRENRLTLPQIKASLQGGGAALNLEAHAFSQLERLVAGLVGYDKSQAATVLLAELSEIAVEDARALDRLEIVRISRGEQGESLSLVEAQLVSIWGQMRAAGFSDELNFKPEMLGFYKQAAEFVAGWEAKTFMERTEGKIDVDVAASMLEAALPLMLNFFGLLRITAFMRNIDAGKVPNVPSIKDPRLTSSALL